MGDGQRRTNLFYLCQKVLDERLPTMAVGAHLDKKEAWKHEA